MYNTYDVHIFNVFNMYDVTSYLFATETETVNVNVNAHFDEPRLFHSII